MFLDLFEQECALCSSFRCPGSAHLCHQQICQHQMGLVAEDFRAVCRDPSPLHTCCLEWVLVSPLASIMEISGC